MKTREVVPKHKERYKTLVGSSILSRTGIAITIVCEAKGNPKPAVKWYLKGVPVVATKNIKILNRGRLRIKSLSSDSVGKYQCLARNPLGIDTATSNVTVLGKVH